MNADKWLCPAFTLHQFILARNSLLNHLKRVTAVCDPEPWIAIIQILKLVRTQVWHRYT